MRKKVRTLLARDPWVVLVAIVVGLILVAMLTRWAFGQETATVTYARGILGRELMLRCGEKRFIPQRMVKEEAEKLVAMQAITKGTVDERDYWLRADAKNAAWRWCQANP